jgi:hypothetical protein
MNLRILLFLSVFLIVFSSCSDSASEEFDNVNPNAISKYIETISVVSGQDPSENTTITVNYDESGRVSSITDGTDSSILVYNESNELTNVTGQGDNLNIEELYESPYDAFETGFVNTYDVNGNPINVTFYEYAYDWQTDTEEQLPYTAEISYDSKPNPYFYTLDAAGLIDVMDQVELNFSMNVSSPEIVQARALFPVNNVTGIVYKDENGVVVFEMEIDYVYSADNYPTSATVTSTSYDEYEGNVETEVNIYSATYTYRD